MTTWVWAPRLPDITSVLLWPRMREAGDRRVATLPLSTISGGRPKVISPRKVLAGMGTGRAAWAWAATGASATRLVSSGAPSRVPAEPMKALSAARRGGGERGLGGADEGAQRGAAGGVTAGHGVDPGAVCRGRILPTPGARRSGLVQRSQPL